MYACMLCIYYGFCFVFMQVTKDLMKRIYVFRRQDILDCSIGMADLFSNYPPLKDPEEVRQYASACTQCKL